MAEVAFYQLLGTPLEKALPRLLEKVVESGRRAVVLGGSEERVEALNAALWTFDQGSFLPHGSARDGRAERQPIYLTSDDENPNDATVVVMVDGIAPADVAQYERCLDMFDGNDADALAAARQRWTACKAGGHSVTYWEQVAGGKWERRA